MAYLKRLEPLWLRRKVTVMELEEASEWMVFAPEASKIKWNEHARVIWGRILVRRREAKAIAEAKQRAADEKAAVDRRAQIAGTIGKIGKEKSA